MQALQLSAEHWWLELDARVAEGRIPGQLLAPLRGMVSAALNAAIPPTTSDRELALFREHLADGVMIGHDLYALMAFIPDDPVKYRQFVYLVRGYHHGRLVPISSSR